MELPKGWHNDPMIRDEVHMRVRGLIREGYTTAEIMVRVGCTNDVVVKQRRRLGIPSFAIAALSAERLEQ